MKTKKNLKIMMIGLLIVITTAISIFATDPTTNESNRFNGWDLVGPTGGDIRAIAIDPREKNRLYVTTLDSQVYTSGDGGKTWRFLVAFNRPETVLDNIMVDVEDSNRIYVSGHHHKIPGGFYYSKDAGMTWNEAKDLKDEAIHGLAQSTKDPNFMVAGAVGKVFFSYNRGVDWKRVTDDKISFSDLIVDSAVIDPSNTNIVYVGTTWRAYKSTDGGKTWNVTVKGMIDDSDIFTLDIDPDNANHIIASACSGIYESFNGGDLWAKIPGIPSTSRRTKSLLRNPAKNGAIYAGTTEGFWLSADNGKTWALTTQRELEINSIAVHPSEPNKIYIATNNYGIMVSNDGGRNFSIFNGNLTSRFMRQIVPDTENPNRFYATTNNTATGGGFIFISEDGGLSWRPSIKNLSVIRVYPNSLLQDKTNPNTIYLGTNMGIFRSLDRGISWDQIKPPKTTPVKKTVAKKTAKSTKSAKPTPTPTVAAVKKIPVITDKVNQLYYSNDGKNGIYAATDKGLYRTYDMATGWEKVSLGNGIDEQVFAVHTASPNTIWVGTARTGVVVSKDGGITWQKMTDIPDSSPISSIKTNPQNPDLVYVGTFQTFYMSRNGGQSWTRRGGNLPIGNYNSILINPNNPNELIVASSMEGRGGIYQSLDGGNMWKQIDSKDLNLPTRRIWTMAFDPNNPNRILVGTNSSGIYRIERESTANTGEGTRPRVASNPN